MGSQAGGEIDLRRVKSTGEVIGDAVRCYARFPVLVAEITLAVIVPYALLVYLAEGSGLLRERAGHSATVGLVVLLLDALFVGPLISALHVHALTDVGEGRRPRAGDVMTRGLRVLPVVAAAQIVAALGIGIGFVALIVPGLVLAARWGVVAQVAALEGVDWRTALRRSAKLSSGSYLHVLGVLIGSGLIGELVNLAGASAVASSAVGVQVAVGVVIKTVTLSFVALSSAVLYFDLGARAGGSR